MSDDRAVQAAAKALSNADGPAFVGSANRRFVAEAAVAAAREVIEAEVRERIAADIEAERDRVWIEPNLVLVNGAQVLDRHVYAAQWTEAARIARGGTNG